jgi:hypothetical protein
MKTKGTKPSRKPLSTPNKFKKAFRLISDAELYDAVMAERIEREETAACIKYLEEGEQ